MKVFTIRRCRRALQIGVAVAFILFPVLNRHRINLFTGNFLSFNAAGLPLSDPLAVLQVALLNGHLAPHLLTGAAIALGLAATHGTVFCSCICPFGLLSEWGHQLSHRLFPRKPDSKSSRIGGFRLKTLILAPSLLGVVFLAGSPSLKQISMPGW